jgi:hypothetical protein
MKLKLVLGPISIPDIDASAFFIPLLFTEVTLHKITSNIHSVTTAEIELLSSIKHQC